MADITVTSADVKLHEGTIRYNKELAETVTVGYAVSLDANGKLTVADANGTEAVSRAVGILVATDDGEATAGSGDRGTVVLLGPVGGFTGMTPGAPVFLSENAGRLTHTAPSSPSKSRSIGFALDANTVFVNAEVTTPGS